MSTLSNFLRRFDHGAAGTAPARCRPIHKDEVRSALSLILGHAGKPASDTAVLDFLQFIMHRGINVADVWVADRDDHDRARLAWAILPVVSPGRTMLLFAPTHLPDKTRAAAARQLTDHVCALYRDRGMHLCQVLLDPHDKPMAAFYEDTGFGRIAELLYLQSPVRGSAAPSLAHQFSWDTYTPENHATFAETILRTYENSLDCPALNGVRHIEDVIAGHRATGEFRPGMWYLLCHGPEPVAVLLLAPAARSEVVELVYLGLTPEARGRGIGDLLLRHAKAAVAAAGFRTLSLAVDSANAPALRLYYRHGFSRVCTKVALMTDLRR